MNRIFGAGERRLDRARRRHRRVGRVAADFGGDLGQVRRWIPLVRVAHISSHGPTSYPFCRSRDPWPRDQRHLPRGVETRPWRRAKLFELFERLRPVFREAGATASGRRAACRSVWHAGSSSSRCRRRRCAAPARRTPGTACRSVPCTAIPSRNAVTFSGKPSPTSSRSRSVHSIERARASRRRAGAISSSVSCCVELHGRQPRAVQDLVRVRVADAAEEPRVGERALERVVLARERARRTASSVASSDLEPAAVELRERVRAAHDVERRALLRARLGEDQRARREVERGERRPCPGRRARRRIPAQAAGDHEVDDEEEIVLEAEHDALAEPATPRPSCPTARRAAGSTVRSTNGLLSAHAARAPARPSAARRAPRRRR